MLEAFRILASPVVRKDDEQIIEASRLAAKLGRPGYGTSGVALGFSARIVYALSIRSCPWSWGY